MQTKSKKVKKEQIQEITAKSPQGALGKARNCYISLPSAPRSTTKRTNNQTEDSSPRMYIRESTSSCGLSIIPPPSGVNQPTKYTPRYGIRAEQILDH